MRNKSFLGGAVVAGLLLVWMPRAIQDTPLPPATTDIQTDTVLATFLTEYDSFFVAAMAENHTPGAAVVIVRNNQVVFCKGYGVRQAGQSTPVDEHTVFRIGSLSKGFAGILAARLAKEGKLQITDPVQWYFPAFTLRDPAQAARVQVKHLLSHTTGLPYHAYTQLIEEGMEVPEIVKTHFPKARLGGKEGAFYSYQNAAFSAIEQVMEKATGKNYTSLLEEKIFRPAGMSHASCTYDDMLRTANKAMPHMPVAGGWAPADISPRYYNAAAAGGVNASASDMGAWLKVMLGSVPEVADAEVLQLALSPQVKTDRERHVLHGWANRGEAYYGLGWRIVAHEGDTIAYHGGYVNGYRSEIAVNRREGLAIAVLMNAATPLSGICIPGFFQRWDQVKKKP